MCVCVYGDTTSMLMGLWVQVVRDVAESLRPICVPAEEVMSLIEEEQEQCAVAQHRLQGEIQHTGQCVHEVEPPHTHTPFHDTQCTCLHTDTCICGWGFTLFPHVCDHSTRHGSHARHSSDGVGNPVH